MGLIRSLLRTLGLPGASTGWPPGHFYSPVPSLDEIRQRASRVFDRSCPELPDIDLRTDDQLRLLSELGEFSMDVPDQPQEGWRYYVGNDQFGRMDARVTIAMVRSLQPRRIVEVGAGYSSALMLDTIDRTPGLKTNVTLIDPYPERLYRLIGKDDAHARILEMPVQDVPRETFDELESSDILFIDSSHVAKAGSDVNFLLFDVLPRLPVGAVVHFHDVMYPFEYPKDWILKQGRFWTEAYLLRAFLAFNRHFQILLFNDYLSQFHRDEVDRHLPGSGLDSGASIWIQRVEAPGG